MRKIAWGAAALALLLPLGGLAQVGARDAQGNLLPDSPSMMTRGEFSGSLLITADPNWQQEWDAPKGEAPHFNLATEVREGGDLYILTFVSNPGLDASGMTNVRCDLKLTRPDGSMSSDDRDLPCFTEKLESDPKRVFLTSVGLKFTAEADDPKGTWRVAMTLHDRNRAVTLPLEASFEMR